MTTLSLSATDSLLLQLTKFSPHVLHPGVISPIPLSLIIPLHFSSLSLTLSLSLPPPAHFFVSSSSSVETFVETFLHSWSETELICSSDLQTFVYCAVSVCVHIMCISMCLAWMQTCAMPMGKSRKI